MATRRRPQSQKQNGRPRAASVGELASIYGCSEKHISEQLRRGAPAKGPDGFDLHGWGAWWRDQGRFRHLGGARDGEARSSDWTIRGERAKALLAEQRLADLLAMYCRREDVERAAARDFTVLRLHVEALPRRCAALVPAAQQPAVRTAVTEVVRTTLTSARAALARWSAQDAHERGKRSSSDSSPFSEVLGAFLDRLDELPERIGAVVRSARQRERIVRAIGLCVDEAREEALRALSLAEAKTKTNQGRNES